MRAAIPFLLAVLAVPPWTASGQENPILSTWAQEETATGLDLGELPGGVEVAPNLDDTEMAFGLQTQDYWLTAPQFIPYKGDTWSSDFFLYYHADTGSGDRLFVAQVELPAGARIHGLQCFFFDEDTAEDALIKLWKVPYDLTTDTPTAIDIATVSSSGSGGFQRSSQSLDETVQYRDGDLVSFYTLIAYLPGSNVEVKFQSCRFSWSRQISTAPSTATFNDVPTSHPFFQHVEALSASEITGGCGNGAFCPDAPLTRGQMAVFLAKALGLHWPY